jgi:hypothetical protein
MRGIIFIFLLICGQARCQLVAQSLDSTKLSSLDTAVATDWSKAIYLSSGYERDGLDYLPPVQVKRMSGIGNYFIRCMLDDYYYFEVIISNFKLEYVFTNDNEE